MDESFFGRSSLDLARQMIEEELRLIIVKKITIKVTIIESIDLLFIPQVKDRSVGRGSKVLWMGNSTRNKERIRKELEAE